MGEVKVLDVSGLCCMGSALIGKRLRKLQPNDRIDLIFDQELQGEVEDRIDKEDCEILETVRMDKAIKVRIKKKGLKNDRD